MTQPETTKKDEEGRSVADVDPAASISTENNNNNAAQPTTETQSTEPAVVVPKTAGLVNQGCTCYLNSLLQLLFQISYFRSAVYRITGSQEGSSLIPRALQELFFQMQERKTPPTTKGLTDAFGWDEREVFVQHDIQEMAALLRDCLENHMKGTPSEGAINRMFEGRGEQVVQTLDGTFTSRRKDTFYDIHLPIQNFNTIEESMRSLIMKDQLVGDNKYKVEVEGKPAVYKDAEKGYRFTQFPPVIFFHLKRFEMDLTSPTLEMKKINSAFEFAETLDLREFETATEGALSDKNDEFQRDSQAVYDLHGVIVHKGTARSGHYYCYIRHYDSEQGKFTDWLEYDDENVQVVDSYLAMETNFGGHRQTLFNGRYITVPNTHNAYILSYVRRADEPVLLAPTPTDVIPSVVKNELRRVMEVDERKAAIEQQRRHQIRVVIATDGVINQVVRRHVLELLPREERVSPSACTYLDVQKANSFSSLYTDISKHLGSDEFPRNTIRLWKWTISNDKVVYRPLTALISFDESRALDLTIGAALLSQVMQEKEIMVHVLLYVDRARPTFEHHYNKHCHLQQRPMRLFLKALVPRDHTLSFVGPLDVFSDRTLMDYFPEIATLLRLAPESVTAVSVSIVHEASRGGHTRVMDLRAPISTLRLAAGDILVVQPAHVSVVHRSLSAGDVIHEARCRRNITIHEVSLPNEPVGDVQALTHWDYNMMCEAIVRLIFEKHGTVLNPDCIQLFRNADHYTPTPSELPVKQSSNVCVADMCHINNYSTDHLFFKMLAVSRLEVENSQQIRVRLFRSDHSVEKDVTVEARGTGTTLQSIIRSAVSSEAATQSTNKTKDATVTSATASLPQQPTTATPLQPHYTIMFVFESRSRPTRYPVEVSMAPDATPQLLTRSLCPGEWIFVYPSSPLRTIVHHDWTQMTSSSSSSSSEDDKEDSSEERKSKPTSSSKLEKKTSRGSITVQTKRIPVAQGEYSGSLGGAIFFGNPLFVEVDPRATTISNVLESILAILNLPSDSDEILQCPLMLVVEESLADPDSLMSERDVDGHCYRGKHYQFSKPEDVMMPYLSDERYIVYLNRRRPKEKPGSRYVATNDPKLTLEKKRSGK